MAKDITVKITGQNPDGSINIQQMDGGNPFGGAGTNTGIVPYNQPTAMQQSGYRAKINGIDVTFGSEADYLKADRAVREMVEAQSTPTLGGMRSTGGGGTGWLRTGAHAAEAVAGFLNGRNVRRKLEDLDTALGDSRDARDELEKLQGNATLAPLIPVLRRLFLAERDATEASISVLEDQLTAIDIQTGSGVAKVAADLMGDGSPFRNEQGGLGSAVAVGAGGLGLGLLLSRDRDDRPRRNRR